MGDEFLIFILWYIKFVFWGILGNKFENFCIRFVSFNFLMLFKWVSFSFRLVKMLEFFNFGVDWLWY